MLREEQKLETLLSFGEFHALFRHFQECSKNKRVVSIESICRAVHEDYTENLHLKIMRVIQQIFDKNFIKISNNCPMCSANNDNPLDNTCQSCGRQVVGSSRIEYKEAPMEWLTLNLNSLPKIKKFLEAIEAPSIPIKKKTKWIKSITSRSRYEPIVEDKKKISEHEKRRNIPAASTPPQMEKKEENVKAESQMIGTSFDNNIRGWVTKQLESISHDLELEMRKENITELIGLYENALKRIESSGHSQKHEKLLLILLHGYCKIHDVPIERKDLVDNFFLDEKEFLSIRKEIQNILITYNEQVRQQEIRKIIENLTRDLKLSDLFYKQSVSILERFWPYLNNTTSRVIAGVVCSINLLINEVDTLKVHHVCHYLNIAQSTIQSQVKKNIFDKLEISGFTTLLESGDLLKKFVRAT